MNYRPSLWKGSGRRKKDNVTLVYLKGPRVVQNTALIYASAQTFMAQLVTAEPSKRVVDMLSFQDWRLRRHQSGWAAFRVLEPNPSRAAVQAG